MKDFLKYTLATIVGLVLSGIIFFFIGSIAISGFIAFSDSETTVGKNSFMFLDLNGELQERYTPNPLSDLLGDTYNGYGLEDILSSIKKAKEHEDIKGIYIQATSLSTSFASLEEIRNALIDFKESGKFIISYADSYTQGLYYLSSVSDKIILNPKGSIEWKGLASQPLFFKNLLEKIGVGIEIFRVGTYKSAVEPFMNTEMSPASREQTVAYATSIWNRMLADVSQSRNISADSLNTIADRMIFFYPAEESLKSGLADTLLYKDGVRSYLKQLLDIDAKDGLRALDLNAMINVKKNVPKDKSGNIVAIYYAYGDIDGSADEGIISKKVVRDLRKLREDENVKAVVLRVNSPGGSAFGSEQIWNEVRLIKAEKPIIVSMGDYAASGGYYISCAADYIFAQPTTITGSIGIFGMVPNFGELSKKIGLDYDVVKTNKFADMLSLVRPMNNDEKTLMQMMVNDGYELFVTRCAEGRNMNAEEIKKIAEGRVWTGEMAKELGLVDELGGLDKALSAAAERAEIENYTVISYPEQKGILASLMEKGSSGIIRSELKSNLGEYYSSFKLIRNFENMDLLQARIPFEPNIK